ncbi:GH18668 [Drosophila grimshawi]|uniref:GH18668 n=2 Tax=Drosophila grimshawi TaxID=7222 RepID=B4JH38_DROGR|nr:GH18668 [Drosophila grimshawi]
MTLFNCVWEAKRRLEKKGRLANRSERFVNAMLVKAVTKQMVIPYSSEEISKCNHIRECQLKKVNNCRLNRWSNESSQSSVLERTQSNQSSLLPPAQMANESSDIPLNLVVTINSQALLTQPVMWVNGETPESPAKSKDMAEAVDVSIESTPDMAWAEAAAQVNTESMTFESRDLELNTQQTESQPVALSNEDYELFGTQVPATSTQTPTQSTEPFL